LHLGGRPDLDTIRSVAAWIFFEPLTDLAD
jgi:hypothetical protein